MPIRVLTDPSAAMPDAWLRTLPISVVPLDIAWPDGSTSSGNESYDAIAERLRNGDGPPTTGASAPGVYTRLISELLLDADGVLVVCPSSDLSTTFQSASIGARELGDARVRVLDSRTAAAGQGIVVAQAALEDDLESATERAVDVASRMHVWATLSQLDFLRRSGRVPAVAAIGAGALRLQPVVRYVGSTPSPVAVVRSASRGTDRLFRAWERTHPGTTVGGGRSIAVAFHTAREQDAGLLVERIRADDPRTDAHAVEVSAALASHTGHGLLGLAWFWDLES